MQLVIIMKIKDIALVMLTHCHHVVVAIVAFLMLMLGVCVFATEEVC